uniref:ATP synthase mitochondrial F1 complex assembly factor 2 n=1 Tax=Panagrolaimus sp. JU765 TaxID=591449 RepID=A0AC34QA15_9BILA
MLVKKLFEIPISRIILSSSRCNSIFAKPRRFYKQVTVEDEINENGGRNYMVLLDKHKLKTQAGKVLKVDSEPLALAIAQEWDAQKEFINKPLMRITGLAFTAIDNPLNETKESLTEKIMEYLDTDTLLHFASEPQNLVKLQHEKWAPILKWFNDTHGLDIKATDNLVDLPQISGNDRSTIKRYLLSHNFWSLNGIQYGVEGAKSLIVTMALMGCHISAEEATHLSHLEQIYQAKVWGNVEWSHDIEHQETCCRLAAAFLFYYFTANSHIKEMQSAVA